MSMTGKCWKHGNALKWQSIALWPISAHIKDTWPRRHRNLSLSPSLSLPLVMYSACQRTAPNMSARPGGVPSEYGKPKTWYATQENICFTFTYLHTHIHIYVCVCVAGNGPAKFKAATNRYFVFHYAKKKKAMSKRNTTTQKTTLKVKRGIKKNENKTKSSNSEKFCRPIFLKFFFCFGRK